MHNQHNLNWLISALKEWPEVPASPVNLQPDLSGVKFDSAAADAGQLAHLAPAQRACSPAQACHADLLVAASLAVHQ